MPHLEKFLTSINVKPEIIEKLKADELPEDFNLEEVAKSHVSTIQEIAIETKLPELKTKFHSEAHNKIMKILIDNSKSSGLVSKEEADAFKKAEDKDIKGIISLLSKSRKSALSEIASTTDETLKKKADEMTEKFLNLQNELEETKTIHESELTKVQSEAQQTYNSLIVDSVITAGNNKLVFAVPEREEADRMLIKMQIEKLAKVGVDGAVTSLDGTKLVKFDETGFYTHVHELQKDIASKFKMLKVSNGGGQLGASGDSPVITGSKGNEKDSPHMKELKKRALDQAEKKNRQLNGV